MAGNGRLVLQTGGRLAQKMGRKCKVEARGGIAIPKRWGCAAMQSPMHGAHGEREIKNFMVTKRELLNNLSDIYKCKVRPSGTFSL